MAGPAYLREAYIRVIRPPAAILESSGPGTKATETARPAACNPGLVTSRVQAESAASASGAARDIATTQNIGVHPILFICFTGHPILLPLAPNECTGQYKSSI